MRKKLFFGYFLLLAMVFVVGCAQENTANAGSANSEVPQPSATTKTVSLSINLEEIGSPTAEIDYVPGMTVGQLLDQQAFIKVDFKDYADLGRLVIAINDIENQATPDHFWQFCINGTTSDLGIDQKKLEASDRVDWHYVTYGETPCKKIGE